MPASVCAMTGYGVFVYGSSSFILPVADEAPELPISTCPYAFALRSVTFAVVNLAFGSFLLRGPPHRWVLCSVALMILGCTCAGASVAAVEPSAAGFTISLIVAGVATAAFYLPVYQPMLAWFPDRKGLVAGFVGVGQASGGSLWNAAAPAIALHTRSSGLFLLYGLTVGSFWLAGVLVTWPPAA